MQSYNNIKQVGSFGSEASSCAIVSSKKLILQIGVLVVVLVYLYASVFQALVSMWWRRGDYSHGFLIPLISLYLVWARRERLRHLGAKPAYIGGFSVLITAGVLLLVGAAGGLITLEALSLVVMVAGLILCLLGKDCFRTISFPVGYLIFMVPITDELGGPLFWSFQLLTAKMVGIFLEAWGAPVLVERQYIVLPTFTLEVIQGCSGVSSLISILALSIPLAFMTQRRGWSKLVLVISGVIFGIVANWMRVFAMGIWAYYGGNVLQEPFHTVQGLFFAQIGFVFLFASAWILSRITAVPEKGALPESFEIRSKVGEAKNQPLRWDRSWLAVLMVLVVTAIFLSTYNRNPVPPKIHLATFPLTSGVWSGKEMDPQKAAFTVTGADHELVRTYGGPSGREFQLYLAYFQSQNHSKKILNYLTAPLHHNARTIDIAIDQQSIISVNKTWIRGARSEQLVFFWYDVDGQILANRHKARLATIWDGLIHGRTNGAFVLVSSDLVNRTDEEEIAREGQVFIQDLFPVLRRYIP